MHQCPICQREFQTLQGVKIHASTKHGGLTDEQLAQAAGMSAVGESDARERMAQFSASMLGPEEGIPQESKSAETIGTTPSPAPAPTGKRVKATPRKLKELITTIPAKLFVACDITLDDEDTKAIEEAVDFLQDLFGVEFAVPEEKYVIQSRFWAFVWVAGVFALIFVKHKIGALFTEKQAIPTAMGENGSEKFL